MRGGEGLGQLEQFAPSPHWPPDPTQFIVWEGWGAWGKFYIAALHGPTKSSWYH